MEGKCLGCRAKLEKPLFFCSMTCMILSGYMNVKANRPHKDLEELKNNKALRLELLNNPKLESGINKEGICRT